MIAGTGNTVGYLTRTYSKGNDMAMLIRRGMAAPPASGGEGRDSAYKPSYGGQSRSDYAMKKAKMAGQKKAMTGGA